MGETKKILIAEDDPASRELLREILDALGYEVIAACDGVEALQKIVAAQPDLVLLDIQMPILDGFAVLRQIRQDTRFATLPVMALTAYAMKEDREKALRAGFNAHISKPVNVAALRTQIEHYLSTKMSAS
ncbi:MAG: two-component system response regulator [Acidobacteria bacterium RIFCSPLOWO2_12_FULL_59_11]|nr:MAG: two-component system response regulator [Acidobacteria bacterium RIFCSPLOWO2_12_FULL_59_11]